jgi:anthranilate synthase/aminodeoxychorismate synthase-like glutamine amidotransferase
VKKVLLVDNYDSFTYNLAQLFGELGAPPLVLRNDAVTVAQAKGLDPSHLVISPGPGNPTQSGVCNDLIREFAGKRPVLGVCLGHQCIGHVFGGTVNRADRMMHGKLSKIWHDGKGVFKGLANPFDATRYHSLVVREEGLPACLQISAHTSEGEIMGLRHKEFPVEGVQFHPESILTKPGRDLARNFLDL